MAEKRPMAFMSYAHIDDRFNKGYLTEFCQCLSGEVCLHLGEEFPIFMDRKDIKWGDSWKKRIGDSIDSTTFLILIITPGFFKSQYCRDELSRFLERERRLERDDLILPVYFIDTPLLEDEKKRNHDELAQCIASRQYADWRKLRFADLGSGEVRQALSELATQIRNALDAMPQASDGDSTKIENKVQSHRKVEPLAAASEERIAVRMVKMPAEVRETLEKQKPIPIATASKGGVPNVVFVGLMKIIDDETIMLADNFFYKTAQNLAENPKISILCYNGETKKSFQIKGNVTVTKEGPDFEAMRAWVHGINNKLPAKSCAVVKITEIYNAMWGPAAGTQVA